MQIPYNVLGCKVLTNDIFFNFIMLCHWLTLQEGNEYYLLF